jgi:hypothetical protein
MRKYGEKGEGGDMFELEKLLGGYGVDRSDACFDVYSNEWESSFKTV